MTIIGMSVMFALDYTVALSTYDVNTGTTNYTLGAYPNIAAGCKIDKIIFSNEGAADQIVQIWDLAGSSVTPVLAQEYVVLSTVTNSTMGGNLQIDYPAHNPLELYGAAFRKSSTGSTVRCNVIYR